MKNKRFWFKYLVTSSEYNDRAVMFNLYLYPFISFEAELYYISISFGFDFRKQ